VDTLLGKVEFEVSEEGNEREVLAHLLRRATVETFRSRLSASDLHGLLEKFEEGLIVETGDLVPGVRVLEQVGTLPGLGGVLDRLDMGDNVDAPVYAASALDFALEGLFLNRRISKEEGATSEGNRTIYGA
jgi:magnesium chelatase subunit I